MIAQPVGCCIEHCQNESCTKTQAAGHSYTTYSLCHKLQAHLYLLLLIMPGPFFASQDAFTILRMHCNCMAVNQAVGDITTWLLVKQSKPGSMPLTMSQPPSSETIPIQLLSNLSTRHASNRVQLQAPQLHRCKVQRRVGLSKYGDG